MLSVGLKQQGDAQHDLRFSELFKQLVDAPAEPARCRRQRPRVRRSDRGCAGSRAVPAGRCDDEVHRQVGRPDRSGRSRLDTGDLSEIFQLDFDADDPKALFTALIKTLQTLSKQLSESNPRGRRGLRQGHPGPRQVAAGSPGQRRVERGRRGQLRREHRGRHDSWRGNLFTQSLVGRSIVVGTQVGIVQAVSRDGKTLTLTKPWESAPAAVRRT